MRSPQALQDLEKLCAAALAVAAAPSATVRTARCSCRCGRVLICAAAHMVPSCMGFALAPRLQVPNLTTSLHSLRTRRLEAAFKGGRGVSAPLFRLLDGAQPHFAEWMGPTTAVWWGYTLLLEKDDEAKAKVRAFGGIPANGWQTRSFHAPRIACAARRTRPRPPPCDRRAAHRGAIPCVSSPGERG